MTGRKGKKRGIASEDGFFGGKLVYNQPPKGFRTSVDSLALACYAWQQSSAAPKFLCDLGCGSGFLALTSALLWPGAKIVGVELSPERASFARANTDDNRMSSQIKILEADMRQCANESSFDMILSNPPYHPLSRGTLPKDPDNARARFVVELNLSSLLKLVESQLNSKGAFFVVYPFERWDDLRTTCSKSGLEITHYRHVHPTPLSPPLLVLAKLTLRHHESAELGPTLGAPMHLENEEMDLGPELERFVGFLSQDTESMDKKQKKATS